MAENIYEILKYAPLDLQLYSTYHRKYITLKRIDDKKLYPIVCKVENNDGIPEEATFNYLGEYYEGNGIKLFPNKEHLSWLNWQLDIFPNCINSVITNKEFEFYKITSSSTLSLYGMDDMETIPMLSVTNLTQFRFASADDIKLWNEQPIQNSYFKAFDKVLVRNKGGMWHCMLFSHQKNNYYFAGGRYWNECVPYNKYTEHLIGISEDFDINSIRKNKK